MNSRVGAIAVLAALVIAAGVGFYVFSARPESGRRANVEAPAAAPAPAPEPRPSSEPAPTVESSPSPRPAARVPDIAPSPAPVEAAPLTATLRIDSDVPGADVFIDRTFVGVTPVTVPDVAPGSHRLNVTATGHEGQSETIEVVPGARDIKIEFMAIRLDLKISVVHKHTLGSCAGTLAATPDGLRYDTANRDDAFTVPLPGLDSFTVDYLKKTLTLKVRNGKTYNFTDPEGNADRLLVFHRDVDKVRGRLIKGQ